MRTGQYTGRSANDKFIVKSSGSEGKVWWGKLNKPYEPERFDAMLRRLQAYLQGRDLFVQDCYGGADPDYRIPVRVVTETAWHSLFARNMFIRELDPAALDELAGRVHRPALPELPRHPRGRRHQQRGLHPRRLRPQDGPHRRHAATPARSRSRSSPC